MGGLDLRSSVAHAEAHYLSATARALKSARTLVYPLADLSAADPSSQPMVELAAALSTITALHTAVVDQYAIWDSNHIDHDTSGDKTYHFHPPLSTTAEAIPTLQDLDNSGSKLSCATRHFAAVVDNHAWIKFYDSICHNHTRASYFLSECMPHAGDFLNALPHSRDTVFVSSTLRFAIQRRLRLRLYPPPPPDMDPYGDDAQNVCHHTPRHDAAVHEWASAAMMTFGSDNVLVDPDHSQPAPDYSPDHIPDITIFNKSPADMHYVLENKVVSNLTKAFRDSNTLLARSASIAFANTGEKYTTIIHGRKTIRIPEGTNANFNRRNCTGHMAGSDGDYPETRRMGHTPVALIHEITSGFHPEGVTFLRELAQHHLDKIPTCFEGQSWTACTFTAYFAQRISLAVRRKVSEQIQTVCTRWTRKRPPRATRAPLQPVPGG